jgi:MFS family permease
VLRGRVASINGLLLLAFTALIASTAAMSLPGRALPWLILRGCVGFGCAGLFISTESWLNAKAPPAERGRIFSRYMIGSFIGLALGQALIIWGRIETTAPLLPASWPCSPWH